MFKQKGTISSLGGKCIKLLDQYPYPGSNISSTENDVSIHSTKVVESCWQTIYRMEI